MNPTRKPRILIGVTGSLDSVLLPNYLRAIKDHLDCELCVLMTPNATNFLRPEAIAMFADRVISGEHPQNWPSERPGGIAAAHDIILVLPATANTLASVAHGLAGTRLATVILAATCPVLFFPVMGGPMLTKAAVQRNLAQLRADGYEVVMPTWREHHDARFDRLHGHHSLPDVDQVLAILRERLGGQVRAVAAA